MNIIQSVDVTTQPTDIEKAIKYSLSQWDSMIIQLADKGTSRKSVQLPGA